MQLPESISQVLNHVRDKITLLYGNRFVSLQLYGSYARNEARKDSDVDLLLVLKDDVDRYSENWKLSNLVLEILKSYGLISSTVQKETCLFFTCIGLSLLNIIINHIKN